MPGAQLEYPAFADDRGPGYWLRFGNVAASRYTFLRADHSNEWRYAFGNPDPADRVVPFERLLSGTSKPPRRLRCILIGDTGEGDRSQYGLLPLIRGLEPDFMIINGDSANPAGRMNLRNARFDDYLHGFFEPYRNLGFPIWAVPGNHEYYSPNNGREFHDVFCTRAHDRIWSDFGIPHVAQPGTYWELNDGDHSGLAIIGIDTGKSGDLDGKRRWWEFWKGRQPADTKQMAWLESRLRIAQARNRSVILMFHIPALCNSEAIAGVQLGILHNIIGSFSCVKLVFCGHEHNYQRYAGPEFHRFVNTRAGATSITADRFPPLVIFGGGGSFIHRTDWDRSDYYCQTRYPSRDQYAELAASGLRIVQSGAWGHTAFGTIVGAVERAALADGDEPRYLGFLLLDLVEAEDGVSPFIATVTPVQLDDLKHLYDHRDQDTIVKVQEDKTLFNPDALEACQRHSLSITIRC